MHQHEERRLESVLGIVKIPQHTASTIGPCLRTRSSNAASSRCWRCKLKNFECEPG
jgi:hypothetical protein